MSIQDYQDIFIDVNDAFLRLTGYKREEIIGHSGKELDLWAILEQRKFVNEHFTKHEMVRDFEFQFRRKDKSVGYGILSAEIISISGNDAALTAVLDITERKLAEAALKKSEKKYRTLFDTMPNGYYLSTPEGKFVDANPAFIRMLGYDNLEELKTLDIPKDLFVQSSEREEILRSNTKFIGNVETYRLKRKDGIIIWVEDNARYLKDENGKVIFNEGICKDITDRKKAEDALRESEQLFNTLAQVSPVGIFRTRPDGYTTYVNPKWIRLAGIPSEKAIGSGWLDAVHPEDREKIKKGWDSATIDNDVSVAEYRFLRPNGTIIWVMGQAIPEFDAFNNVVGYVGTITDITDRKLAEESLKESEERLRILAEKTGTIVYDRDLISHKVHREGAIEEVLGYKKEELTGDGKDLLRLSMDDKDREEYLKNFNEIIEKPGSYSLSYKLKHKNGNFIFIEDNGIVLPDETGKPVRVLGSMKDITERIKMETALKESEELHRKLVMTVPDLIIRTDINGKIIFANESLLQSLGYIPREKMLGRNIFEFISPKDRARAIENTRLMFERPLGVQEYNLVYDDGTEIICEVNGDVILDADSNPIGMVSVVRDITERKKSEEDLRKLSHAVEQSQVSIIITNKEAVIEYVNPKFCEVTGYSCEEVIGKNPRILQSGEWKKEAYSGMWSDISSGRSWRGIFHNKKKNGELFWESVHISPIKDINGEITHYVAVKEDITEKVKNEEQLAKYREHLEEMVEERTSQLNSQNNFLRALIDTIPNPLYVKDNDGRYTDANPAFEKFFGIKKDELIGQKSNILLSEESRKISVGADEKLKNERGFVTYELILDRSDGKKVPAIIYKSSFGLSADQPEGIMGMFVDISERKEMEEKTVQALNREKELNEMKTNFISMASHEFRTPLTTILASADLIEMHYSKWSEEKVINHIIKIQDSVNYMTSLLDDVLTLSRTDRGKVKFAPTKVNLKELCAQLMNEIQYQTLPGHNLVFDYKLGLEKYILDNKLLNQILSNLLSNAVKYSPEGGKILLEVTQKEDLIQFIVQDEGLGIDKNDIKNIFEPFYRGKNVTDIHGSGLGLIIVKNAVELHGGQISIESELNKGTKIIFTIRSS